MLRQTDKRLNLLPRLAECFLDGRRQDQVEHSIAEMLAQRIYGLALGYEDLNDHEQLRKDPLFGVLAGREEVDTALAGKSTLNRMELGAGTKDRYKKITFWKEAIERCRILWQEPPLLLAVQWQVAFQANLSIGDDTAK